MNFIEIFKMKYNLKSYFRNFIQTINVKLDKYKKILISSK